MNPKDRVYKVLNHEIPDVCPVLIRAMYNKIQYEYVNNYEISEQDECFFWRDLSPLIAMKIDAFDYNIPTKKPNVKLENGGIVGPLGRIHKNGAYRDGLFKSREIFRDWQEKYPYKKVDENDPENFRKMIDLAGDRIAIFANLKGYFETTWESMGLGTFAQYLRRDKSFIVEIIDAIEDYTYSCAKELVEFGIEFISIADDMGFKNGSITKEKFYYEHIFPRYKRINNLVHKSGGKTYLHSEGNITNLMDGIIDCGFDGVQGLTPIDGIDIGEIKEKYGDKIALIGGLSHAPLLSTDPLQNVKKKVNEVFQMAGKNGGLMIGPSAAIDDTCKVENVLEMIKAIHNCTYSTNISKI